MTDSKIERVNWRSDIHDSSTNRSASNVEATVYTSNFVSILYDCYNVRTWDDIINVGNFSIRGTGWDMIQVNNIPPTDFGSIILDNTNNIRIHLKQITLTEFGMVGTNRNYKVFNICSNTNSINALDDMVKSNPTYMFELVLNDDRITQLIPVSGILPTPVVSRHYRPCILSLMQAHLWRYLSPQQKLTWTLEFDKLYYE